MSLPPREAIEVEALQTDLYLDSLLIGTHRPARVPAPGEEPDPAIRDAAARLERDLVRVHPSFRFEERLAARLAEVAASLRLPAAAGLGGEAVIHVGPLPRGVHPSFDPDLLEPVDEMQTEAALHLSRPVLIGGAITSAALSIAAYLAWRRARPPLSPMARAVRAARHARLGFVGPAPAQWRRPH
jgi:hypothetical protein